MVPQAAPANAFAKTCLPLSRLTAAAPVDTRSALADCAACADCADCAGEYGVLAARAVLV